MKGLARADVPQRSCVNLMRSVLFTARLRPCAAAIRMAACVGNRGDDGGLPSGLAIARAYSTAR